MLFVRAACTAKEQGAVAVTGIVALFPDVIEEATRLIRIVEAVVAAVDAPLAGLRIQQMHVDVVVRDYRHWITPSPPAGPKRGKSIVYPPNSLTTDCKSVEP